MSAEDSIRDTRIENLLHPADAMNIEAEPHKFLETAADLATRARIFKSYVTGPLDKGNYSRVSRSLGLFVSLYHVLTEEELSVICRAKEVLDDEVTDVVRGLADTSTVIELNKLRLRRPGLTALARQTYQDKITAAEATLAYDQKNLGRLLEDIGLLGGIEEEETFVNSLYASFNSPRSSH